MVNDPKPLDISRRLGRARKVAFPGKLTLKRTPGSLIGQKKRSRMLEKREQESHQSNEMNGAPWDEANDVEAADKAKSNGGEANESGNWGTLIQAAIRSQTAFKSTKRDEYQRVVDSRTPMTCPAMASDAHSHNPILWYPRPAYQSSPGNNLFDEVKQVRIWWTSLMEVPLPTHTEFQEAQGFRLFLITIHHHQCGRLLRLMRCFIRQRTRPNDNPCNCNISLDANPPETDNDGHGWYPTPNAFLNRFLHHPKENIQRANAYGRELYMLLYSIIYTSERLTSTNRISRVKSWTTIHITLHDLELGEYISSGEQAIAHHTKAFMYLLDMFVFENRPLSSQLLQAVYSILRGGRQSGIDGSVHQADLSQTLDQLRLFETWHSNKESRAVVKEQGSIAAAAECCHVFVCLQPFEKPANELLARMILNACLLKLGCVMTTFERSVRDLYGGLKPAVGQLGCSLDQIMSSVMETTLVLPVLLDGDEEDVLVISRPVQPVPLTDNSADGDSGIEM